MAKRKHYYYEWGTERLGYVSVWHIGERGARTRSEYRQGGGVAARLRILVSVGVR